ncbi:MAG: BrnA antitoxin family protein [Granulicella sp.]
MTTRKKKAPAPKSRGKKQPTKIKKIAASREPDAKVKKEQITLRLDADVIDFFRALGVGYQAKMSGYLGVAMADARIRSKTEIAGQPWYEESRNHEAMANRIFRPRKEQLTLRVDADTVAWFRSRGKGYQSKMNRVLRLMMIEMLRGTEMAQEDDDQD